MYLHTSMARITGKGAGSVSIRRARPDDRDESDQLPIPLAIAVAASTIPVTRTACTALILAIAGAFVRSGDKPFATSTRQRIKVAMGHISSARMASRSAIFVQKAWLAR